MSKHLSIVLLLLFSLLAGNLTGCASMKSSDSLAIEVKEVVTARGIMLVVEDILFEYNQDELRPQATPILNKIAEIINRYPNRQILVEGHTDSRGSSAYNQQLSQRRAESVQKALTARGINPDLISTFDYGEKLPIASNDTEEGRQKNRRVEVTIMKEDFLKK